MFEKFADIFKRRRECRNNHAQPETEPARCGNCNALLGEDDQYCYDRE